MIQIDSIKHNIIRTGKLRENRYEPQELKVIPNKMKN